MAAGLGFKTFVSGEVLTAADTNGYLMQGINVFANASARNAAITSPQEGQFCFLKDTNSTEYYDGAAWVSGVEGDISGVTAGTGISGGGTSGTVTITNSMATEITAKGDLIVGTGSATFDNLAAGSNGETLVADSSTTTGLRWQGSQAAGRNLVINGDFSNWQRGTTFTSPSFADYTADRFKNTNYNVAPTTYSITRQNFATADAPANLAESGYFFRSSLTTIGSTTVYDTCSQRIEGVMNSGAIMTLSFYAKSDSSRSQSVTGAQNFGSGGSAEVTSLTSTSFTTTTAWQRFTFTFTIGSTSGKTIGTSPYFYFFLRQACASGSVLDVTGVQLEYGSVATPFQTASGSLGGELQLCQRYYYRVYPNTSGRYSTGQCTTTTTAGLWTPYPVTMRTTPTALEQSGTATDYRLQDSAGNGVTCSSVPVFQIATTAGASSVLTVASGIVAGNGTIGFAANANSYLGWSAEL